MSRKCYGKGWVEVKLVEVNFFGTDSCPLTLNGLFVSQSSCLAPFHLLLAALAGVGPGVGRSIASLIFFALDRCGLP